MLEPELYTKHIHKLYAAAYKCLPLYIVFDLINKHDGNSER